jgi:hypothetical protein
MNKIKNILKFILILPIFIILRPAINIFFSLWIDVNIKAVQLKFGSISESHHLSIAIPLELIKSFTFGFLPLYLVWHMVPKYKKAIVIILSVIKILFIIFIFIFFSYQHDYNQIHNVIMTIAEISGLVTFWLYLKKVKQPI